MVLPSPSGVGQPLVLLLSPPKPPADGRMPPQPVCHNEALSDPEKHALGLLSMPKNLVRVSPACSCSGVGVLERVGIRAAASSGVAAHPNAPPMPLKIAGRGSEGLPYAGASAFVNIQEGGVAVLLGVGW